MSSRFDSHGIDPAAMLNRLLTAWRTTHDPALEPAITRIGIGLARARGPLSAPNADSREDAWHALAAARDVADVDRLLEETWPMSPGLALARIDALASFDPDPRIAAKLVVTMDSLGSQASEPMHHAADKLLARCPTRTIRAALEALDITYGRYRESLAALRALEIGAADPALIAAAAPDDHVQPLLDALVRDPGNDGVRAVLADAWQAAGDPRGMFVALQSSPRATAQHRAGRMLRMYRGQWLQHLPRLVRDDDMFERGFLTKAHSTASGATLIMSFDRYEWVTVEELAIDGGNCEIECLLRRMPLLRVFSSPHDDVLKRVITTGPYPSIRVFGGGRNFRLRDRTAFPNLAVVAQRWSAPDWSVEHYREVSRAAAELGLEAIVHVDFPIHAIGVAFAERHHGPPETRLSLEHSELYPFKSAGWRVRLRRDHQRVDLACAGEAADRQIGQILKRLAAAGATEIGVHVPGSTRALRDQLYDELLLSPPLALDFHGEPFDLQGYGDEREPVRVEAAALARNDAELQPVLDRQQRRAESARLPAGGRAILRWLTASAVIATAVVGYILVGWWGIPLGPIALIVAIVLGVVIHHVASGS